MRGKGWKCMNCGGVFDRLLDIGSGTWYDPPDYVCPFCRSGDVTDLWFKCDSCGKEFEVDDMENDALCKGCADKAINAMKAYMEHGTEMNQGDRDNFLTIWGCM